MRCGTIDPHEHERGGATESRENTCGADEIMMVDVTRDMGDVCTLRMDNGFFVVERETVRGVRVDLKNQFGL